MFSIDRVLDVSLLVHLQPRTSHRKLPRSLRVLFKTATMYSHIPFSQTPSNALLSLSKWRSTDIVSFISVKNIFDALFKLDRFIFMAMEITLSPHDLYLISNCYRLKEASMSDLAIARSYFTGLLSGSKISDDALCAGSISSEDPLYVSDPVGYIKEIFSSLKLKNGHPEWFLRPDVCESTGSFRELLISAWENFIKHPDTLFDDNSDKSLAVLNLLYKNGANDKKFFSLPCIAFLFSSFLLKFFAKNITKSSLRKDAISHFSISLMKRLSIFLYPDLGIQCCLNLMQITGCIINAIHGREWYGNMPPIVVRKITISDGEIVCCIPLIENLKSYSFAIEEFSINDFAERIDSLYDEGGRTSRFNPIYYNLEIGGVSGFEIWQVWYGAFSSFISSNFLNRAGITNSPSSLHSLSSLSILNNIVRNNLDQENVSFLAKSSSLSIESNMLEPSCLTARCDNFIERSKNLSLCKMRLNFTSLLLWQLELFLTMTDIDILSCGKDIDDYQIVLKTILRLLPFCEFTFLGFIKCYAACEWFLINFFNFCNYNSNGKEVILHAGSSDCGEFIWKLIFNAIQVDSSDVRWIFCKPIFCRRVSVLYCRYFLERC